MRIGSVPSTKARELIWAVVLPLARDYSKVTLEITIRAEGGEGTSRSELDLTVLEGLRQLGIEVWISKRASYRTTPCWVAGRSEVFPSLCFPPSVSLYGFRP